MRKLLAVLVLVFAVLSYVRLAVAQQGWIQTQIVSGVLSIPSYRMVLWAQKNAALTRAEEDANWLSGLGVYVTVSAETGTADTVTLVETAGNLQTLRLQANGSHSITFTHTALAIELPGGGNYTLLPGEIVEFVVMGPNFIRMVAGAGSGGTPGSGDISTVFGCTSGNCVNIPVLDGQLLNFAQVNPNTSTEGLVLPQASSCSGAVANGQVCWQGGSQLYVGNGSTAVLVTGSGGGGGTFSKNITDANSEANALIVGNATQKLHLWGDSNGGTIRCKNGTADCWLDLFAQPTFGIRFWAGGNVIEQIDGNGVHTYSGVGRVWKPVQFGPWTLRGDGTECDATPTEETIAGSKYDAVRCSMPGTEAPGYITSSPFPIRLPNNFDKTSGIYFVLHAYLRRDDDVDATHYGFMQLDCFTLGEAPGSYSSNGSPQNLPITIARPLWGRISLSSTNTIDTDTTGANCNPGDTFIFRWTSCDSDTTPIPGCSDSAGAETATSIYNVTMFYRENSRTN